MRCRELVSVAELSASDRSAFVNAVLALKAAPSKIPAAGTAVTAGGGTPNRYDDYVWMHNTVGVSAHFGSAFGPWHREFLRQFEVDLRQVSGNPNVVIPYWDFTTGRAPGDANWPFTDDLVGPLGDGSGLVASGPFSNPATFRMNIRRRVFRDDNAAQVPDTNVQLRRRPGGVSAGFNLPTAANARQGMAMTTPYDATPFNEASLLQTATNAIIQGWLAQSFRKYLEWALHNGVHTWIGGQDDWQAGAAPAFIGGPMSFPDVAVNDPIFWLHHCNVDRLWTTWQQRRPPGTYVPATGANAGHNLNDAMRHFEPAAAGNFNAPLLSRPADLVDSRGLDLWYTSDLPLITLVSPSVDFGDVPANLTTDWPVRFDVRTCRRVKFRLTGVGGANFRIPPGQGDVLADHHDTIDPVRANVFVEFQALGAANAVQSGSAAISAFIDDTEGYYTGTPGAEFQVGSWTVGLTARPAPAPRAAVTLVLDRSGSMSESAGPNGSKFDLLRSSLQVIGAVLRDDDAIGIVSYDDFVATMTSPSIIAMGSVSPAGAGRQAVETARNSPDLTPRGMTAIGLGMIQGATALQTVQSDANYTTKAMVVMTDGNENSGPSVTSQPVQDAIAWFSDAVYAIGLGDENNVSAGTLGAIANYQLITGRITSSEQRFLLTKYFLQILARISRNAIVVDPQGDLRPGDEHRIPFHIADADVSLDVIALSPLPWFLDFTLEAPDGTVIAPGASPNVRFQLDAQDALYRTGLPAIPGNSAGTHAGQWTAVLRIRNLSTGAAAVNVRQVAAALEQGDLAEIARRGALPYQLLVQTYSNLNMNVGVDQDGYLPGATLDLTAELKEYRVPVPAGARVVVTVTEPDGHEVPITLAETAPGRFAGTHATSKQGLYRCYFRAEGLTRGGKRFQREEMRTAVISRRVRPGTDGHYPGSHPGTTPDGDGGHRVCDLLACLLREPSVQRLLKRQEVDSREVEQCLRRYCSDADSAHDQEQDEREDSPMNPDMDKVLREIALLRRELRTAAPRAIRNLDQLLTAAPPAKAPDAHVRGVAAGGGDEHGDHGDYGDGNDGDAGDAGNDHHHHGPLPFVVFDEDGKPTRVVQPATEKLMGEDAGPDPGAGDVNPGQPHGDHDHGDHDHGADGHGAHGHSGSGARGGKAANRRTRPKRS